MALAALYRAGRVAFVIPVARFPVVVLILELHPADAVDLLVDKLFVAGRAVFGRLVHALAELQVFRGVRPNEKIAHHPRRAPPRELHCQRYCLGCTTVKLALPWMSVFWME